MAEEKEMCPSCCERKKHRQEAEYQDMKPMVDQQNIQIEVQREEYRQSEQVTRKDDSQMEEHRFDAKEEGKGQYQRQEQRKKKQKEDRVVIKGAIGGFDVKI